MSFKVMTSKHFHSTVNPQNRFPTHYADIYTGLDKLHRSNKRKLRHHISLQGCKKSIYRCGASNKKQLKTKQPCLVIFQTHWLTLSHWSIENGSDPLICNYLHAQRMLTHVPSVNWKHQQKQICVRCFFVFFTGSEVVTDGNVWKARRIWASTDKKSSGRTRDLR